MFKKPVTMFFAGDGVPSSGGMSSSTGVPNQGMSGGEQSDADREQLRKELDEAKAQAKQYEIDMRRLQSTLDSTYSQKESQWKQRMQEMEDKLQKVVTSNMDEDERIRYEAETWKAKAQREAEQREAIQQQLENYKMQQEYARAFTELGIDPSKLDYSSPQALTTSGWAAVIAQMNDLRAKVQNPPTPVIQSQNPPQSQPAPQQRVTPPQTTISQGGTPPTVQTYAELRKVIGNQIGKPDLSEEEMFRLAETGKIDIDAILKNAGLD